MEEIIANTKALRITFHKGGTVDFVLVGTSRSGFKLFKASEKPGGWEPAEKIGEIPPGPRSPINWPTRSALRLLKTKGLRVKAYVWVNLN